MKILFLDVDGPLIPNRMYFAGMPRFDNGVWRYDPLAVEMVKYLINKHNVKLVYNSSHNHDGDDHMRVQATANGLDLAHFHDDIITGFPLKHMNRLNAISEWLTYHPEVTRWAVFDDANIEHVNAIKINFHTGIMFEDVKRAEYLLADEGKSKELAANFLKSQIWTG